jgi:hypothetical protein
LPWSAPRPPAATSPIHVIIDIIHVLEYIWDAAWSFHKAGDPAAEDWVAIRALTVLAGDSDRAAAEITAEADTAGLEGSRRSGAATSSASTSDSIPALTRDNAHSRPDWSAHSKRAEGPSLTCSPVLTTRITGASLN